MNPKTYGFFVAFVISNTIELIMFGTEEEDQDRPTPLLPLEKYGRVARYLQQQEGCFKDNERVHCFE